MKLTEALKLSRVEPDILLTQQDRSSAICIIDDDIIIKTLCDFDDQDASFTRQMHNVTETYDELPNAPTSSPDLYLCTAYSAIPFADMLRGYYSAAGAVLPAIGYIKASRREEWQTGQFQQLESVRIKASLEKLPRHVCVIEEFVVTGQTLLLAKNILETAGITKVSAIRGRWDPIGISHKGQIDTENVTSKDAERLFRLGEAAFTLNAT